MSNESTVEDWDTAAALWEYAITSRLTSTKPGNPMTNGLNDDGKDGDQMEGIETTETREKPVGEHALLMTETGINPSKNREKGLEIAMENWGVPAYWLAQNGVLSAYEAPQKPLPLLLWLTLPGLLTDLHLENPLHWSLM